MVHAVRVAAPPTIDGRLDDEPWIVAPAAVDLTQRDPDNGQAMTRATRIQFAYDDRYLYVAVTCLDDSGDVVATGLGRRDELPPTDMVRSRSTRGTIIRPATRFRPIRPDGRETSRQPMTTGTIATTTGCGTFERR